MAGGARAFTDEDPEPTLRRLGIAPRGRRIPARERVAELVERRASAHERFLESGQRLPGVDEHCLVIAG